MKPFSKTFSLTKGNHAPARVIDSIKSDINKHIKRERANELPEGIDFWDFKCKVGPDVEKASNVHLAAIGKAIDKAASSSTTESIFVEINTIAKRRKPSKPKPTVKPESLDFLPPAKDPGESA